MYQLPWQLVPNRVRTLGGREIARFRGEANPRHTPDGAESWVGSVTQAVGATDAHPSLGCSQVRLPLMRYRFSLMYSASSAGWILPDRSAVPVLAPTVTGKFQNRP